MRGQQEGQEQQQEQEQQQQQQDSDHKWLTVCAWRCCIGQLDEENIALNMFCQ